MFRAFVLCTVFQTNFLNLDGSCPLKYKYTVCPHTMGDVTAVCFLEPHKVEFYNDNNQSQFSGSRHNAAVFVLSWHASCPCNTKGKDFVVTVGLTPHLGLTGNW